MASLPDPSPRPAVPALLAAALGVPQTARLRVRFGRRGAMRASVTVTPTGLLAIGGLVAAVLLSTATLVRAAGDARAPRAG